MARTVTSTELANKALTLLGTSTILNNIEDADAADAKVLRLHINSAFESALLVYDWSFATGFTEEPMVLLRECPSSGFGFAYQAPKDSLRVRQIAQKRAFVHDVDQYVEDIEQYREFIGPNGIEIHCDLADAHAEFTRNIAVESAYPNSFARIAAAYLALDAGSGIITDNFAKIKRELKSDIKLWINRAIAEDLTNRSAKIRPVSPFIRSRFPDYRFYGQGDSY